MTKTDATRRDTVSQDGIGIEAAAKVLGVSRRTVQRRIKAGELECIEVDGERLVVLPATVSRRVATEPASIDATPRQIDATDSDTVSQVLREVLEREREQNQFLRSLLEARDRDAAELRAALREALKLAPKQLTDGSKLEQVETGRENAPQAALTTNASQTTPGPITGAVGRSGTRVLKPWQRVIMRMIGAR
jgi:excisionase family DNA binding protein